MDRGKVMRSESGALLEFKVVSPRTVELGTPFSTLRIATCKGYVLFDSTLMLIPARFPVAPAVKVCAMNWQHSLIAAPALVGEVKDWSTTSLAAVGWATIASANK